MIYKKNEYIVANNAVVTDEDLEEGIKKANEINEIITITWSGPGWRWYRNELNGYHIDIKPGDTLERLKENLPNIYGI